MLRQIEEIAIRINHSNEFHRTLGEKIRQLIKTGTCNHIELDGKVAAVDGGIVAKELHGVDIILLKAVSAIFTYKQNTLENATYFPSAFPKERLEVSHGIDSEELKYFKALHRIESEINCAIATLKNNEIGTLILDGSLVMQPSDKPEKNSKFREKFDELTAKYEELFSECEKKEVNLIAIVKDSRGRHFLDKLLEEKKADFTDREIHAIGKTVDSLMLNHVLQQGEATEFIKFAKNYSDHPILCQFKASIADKVKISYIKPSRFDHPLRIEVFDFGNAETCRNTAFTLSKINDAYAYPAILIEADLRAAVKEEDLEYVISSLKSKLSHSIEMRKHTRPFR